MRKQPVCWPWHIYFNTSEYHFVSVLADEHPLNPFCTYSGVHHLETTCSTCIAYQDTTSASLEREALWHLGDAKPNWSYSGLSWNVMDLSIKDCQPKVPGQLPLLPPCLCPSDFSVHPLTSQPPGFSARVGPIWFVLNCCGYPWTLPTWGLELLDYCQLSSKYQYIIRTYQKV